MSDLKPIGFIVEQKNIFHYKMGGLFGRKREHHEWVRFSSKIYKTLEIAEQAYQQCPYGGGDSGYNMEGRIIPVYIKEEELIKIIKKEKL